MSLSSYAKALAAYGAAVAVGAAAVHFTNYSEGYHVFASDGRALHIGRISGPYWSNKHFYDAALVDVSRCANAPPQAEGGMDYVSIERHKGRDLAIYRVGKADAVRIGAMPPSDQPAAIEALRRL